MRRESASRSIRERCACPCLCPVPIHLFVFTRFKSKNDVIWKSLEADEVFPFSSKGLLRLASRYLLYDKGI
jgi:hypothetical protein